MVYYYLSLNTLKSIPLNTKKLEEIDRFTRNFTNEEELKNYLLKHNLITKSDIHKKLFITYKFNYKINKSSIIYRDDFKYTDVNYLRNYLLSKKNDTETLCKIFNKIRFNKSQESNLYELRYYLSRKDYCEESFIENTINKIVNKECFTYNRKKDEYKINYKSLRDLGQLVKEEKIQVKEEAKQLSFFDKKRT